MTARALSTAEILPLLEDWLEAEFMLGPWTTRRPGSRR
jgi:hypothetical protein